MQVLWITYISALTKDDGKQNMPCIDSTLGGIISCLSQLDQSHALKVLGSCLIDSCSARCAHVTQFVVPSVTSTQTPLMHAHKSKGQVNQMWSWCQVRIKLEEKMRSQWGDKRSVDKVTYLCLLFQMSQTGHMIRCVKQHNNKDKVVYFRWYLTQKILN